MKNIDVTIRCPNCGEKINMSYFPGRPAPVCSNPSSPAFSDSGDPEELDGPEACPHCRVILDYDDQTLYEAAAEQAQKRTPSYEPEP